MTAELVLLAELELELKLETATAAAGGGGGGGGAAAAVPVPVPQPIVLQPIAIATVVVGPFTAKLVGVQMMHIECFLRCTLVTMAKLAAAIAGNGSKKVGPFIAVIPAFTSAQLRLLRLTCII